jgi:hypothetical protein
MAGGYARKVEDTVDVHLQSIRRATDLLESGVPMDGRKHRA